MRSLLSSNVTFKVHMFAYALEVIRKSKVNNEVILSGEKHAHLVFLSLYRSVQGVKPFHQEGSRRTNFSSLFQNSTAAYNLGPLTLMSSLRGRKPVQILSNL